MDPNFLSNKNITKPNIAIKIPCPESTNIIANKNGKVDTVNIPGFIS